MGNDNQSHIDTFIMQILFSVCDVKISDAIKNHLNYNKLYHNVRTLNSFVYIVIKVN